MGEDPVACLKVLVNDVLLLNPHAEAIFDIFIDLSRNSFSVMFSRRFAVMSFGTYVFLHFALCFIKCPPCRGAYPTKSIILSYAGQFFIYAVIAFASFAL